MPNVFTALTPVAFSVAQEVSGEAFGAIDSISANFDDKGVAKGDKIKLPVAPTRSTSAFTPAATPPEGTAATAEAIEVEITKSQKVSWNLTGEQQLSLQNGGTDQEWVRQMLAQGMRALRNEAEVDCVNAIKVGASRAVGTAGTNPFATNIDIIPDVRKVLLDNGAPLADLQLVINSTAGTAARKLGIIQQAYQAGNDEERRSGRLLRQFGFEIKESAGIALHTAGAGTGYDVNFGAGYAVGDKTLTLDGGTVNTTGIKAGDAVTFVGDTNQYVVNTGLVATGGDILIGRPGLRATLADAVEMTIGGSYTPNLAFERSAVVGIMRPPIMPANPTMKQMLISDSKGMTYLLVEIAQYGQVSWELHLAWGFKVAQGEHVALVKG